MGPFVCYYLFIVCVIFKKGPGGKEEEEEEEEKTMPEHSIDYEKIAKDEVADANSNAEALHCVAYDCFEQATCVLFYGNTGTRPFPMCKECSGWKRKPDSYFYSDFSEKAVRKGGIGERVASVQIDA